VPNQRPAAIKELVRRTILERAPHGVTVSFTDQHQGDPYVVVPPGRPNTPAGQSPVLARAFRSVDKAVTEIWAVRRSTCARAAASRSSPRSSA